MIKILIVTHGPLAQGIIDSTELIIGKQEGIDFISINSGDNIQQIKNNVENVLKDINDGDGVLAFVDLFGGTPSNIMSQLMHEDNFFCITGLNMPMLVEALNSRDTCSIEELAEKCLEVGKSGILSINSILKKS